MNAIEELAQENQEIQKIELYISCRTLKDTDILSKSDPFVILYQKDKTQKWFEYQRTEVVMNNLNPNFSKTFVLDFHFEKQQQVKFDVLDYDNQTSTTFIGTVETSLGTIVGAKNSTVVYQLYDKSQKKSGKLVVRAEKVMQCMEYAKFNWSGYKLKDTRFFGKTCPFLRFYKTAENSNNLLVYQTENVNSNLQPQFKQFVINFGKLANGDPNHPILVELWDYHTNGKHVQLGSFTFTINNLTDNKIKEFKAVDKKNQMVGMFYLDHFCIDIRPSFLDYIRGGLQLALISAIDFTASNGDPSSPRSLHSVQQVQFNDYQKALKSVGEILLNYDHDKQVPMFGFGGKPRMPNMTSNVVLHCFPMCGNPMQPEVFGLNGIMECYKYAINNVILSGPTLFGPLLKEAMKVAEAAKQAYQQNPSDDQYFILLILTDGEIHDMEESKRCIVQSSFLPLSIIIIGIGNADFTNMDVLDGDEGLWDSNGNKAKRDLVQFVPFNKYQNNSQLLSEKVLEELPRQVEEYMALVGRKPQAPLRLNSLQTMKTFQEEKLKNYNDIPIIDPMAQQQQQQFPQQQRAQTDVNFQQFQMPGQQQQQYVPYQMNQQFQQQRTFQDNQQQHMNLNNSNNRRGSYPDNIGQQIPFQQAPQGFQQQQSVYNQYQQFQPQQKFQGNQ